MGLDVELEFEREKAKRVEERRRESLRKVVERGEGSIWKGECGESGG